MWGKIIIPMYRLWLNGLYGLYGPRCPLSSKRPINLISLSLRILGGCLGLGWWLGVRRRHEAQTMRLQRCLNVGLDKPVQCWCVRRGWRLQRGPVRSWYGDGRRSGCGCSSHSGCGRGVVSVCGQLSLTSPWLVPLLLGCTGTRPVKNSLSNEVGALPFCECLLAFLVHRRLADPALADWMSGRP